MQQIIRRNISELTYFTVKELRACIFAGSFFVVLALSNYLPLGPLPRYDFLLIFAVLMQIVLVWSKLETWDELKAICIFHVIGLALEIFKTQPSIGSWSYPEFAYSKVFGVPLYAGFMHAAVASYMMQAWRLFDLKLRNYPSYWISIPIAALIYLNFFTHHFIGDYRWWLILALIWIFRKTIVEFTPKSARYQMPLALSFVLIGFFIWIAENIATYFGAWVYPNQHEQWQMVSIGKVSSWALLVVITFIIVADLKHLRERVHLRNAPPKAMDDRVRVLSEHIAQRLRERTKG
jgi:uncharacterized membrane protein YoaT (DUF817 family)